MEAGTIAVKNCRRHTKPVQIWEEKVENPDPLLGDPLHDERHSFKTTHPLCEGDVPLQLHYKVTSNVDPNREKAAQCGGRKGAEE